MIRRGLLIVVTVVLAGELLAMLTAWAGDPSGATKGRRSRTVEIHLKIPECLQREYYEQVTKFSRAAYPQWQEKAMSEYWKRWCFREEYLLTRINNADQPQAILGDDPGANIAFPDGTAIALSFENPMPGMIVSTRDKPLTALEAQACAEKVVIRLGPAPTGKDDWLMQEPAKWDEDTYWFAWFEKKPHPFDHAGMKVEIYVQASTGLIKGITWRAALPPPKVTYADIVKEGKTAIVDFEEKSLFLEEQFNNCRRLDIWRYEVPAQMYGEPSGSTVWDADSGELMYSVLLGGGSVKKPYRNPKYFIQPTEVELKKYLEELMAARVKELEAEHKAKAQPAPEPKDKPQPPPAKDK